MTIWIGELIEREIIVNVNKINVKSLSAMGVATLKVGKIPNSQMNKSDDVVIIRSYRRFLIFR